MTPAVYVNRFSITINTSGICKLTFGESDGPDAAPEDRTSVAMVIDDAVALRDLLSKLLEEVEQ